MFAGNILLTIVVAIIIQSDAAMVLPKTAGTSQERISSSASKAGIYTGFEHASLTGIGRRRTVKGTSSLASMPSCDYNPPTLNDDDYSENDEFQLHVGKAMDTLRKDYPKMLTSQPDFSIYDRDIEVVDPSFVTLHGIRAYKSAFSLLHAVIKVFYCNERSGLTFRTCYDTARRNIRIHWNVEVVPRELFGGSRTTLFVDGISVYELNRKTGNITQHRIEHLLINDVPVQPTEGVIAALQENAITCPNFITTEDPSQQGHVHRTGDPRVAVDGSGPIAFSFQRSFGFPSFSSSPSSLFSYEASSDASGNGQAESEEGISPDVAAYPNLDWTALEAKNKSRKKFGLKALSPEEFMVLESQVKEMESQQQILRAEAQAAKAAAEMAEAAKKDKRPGFLDSVFGDALKDTCQSNFDCQRPEVCCDFKVKKACCSSGSTIWSGVMGNQPQMQRVRVPASNGPTEYPPGQGPDNLPPPRDDRYY